ENAAGAFAHQLWLGLTATGLGAVVNLNSESPPPGTGDPTGGGLFPPQPRPLVAERRLAVVDLLLDHLELLGSRASEPSRPGGAPRLAGPTLLIDWHLTERDFAPQRAERLLRVAHRAAEGTTLRFVFDRSRRPVALAEGLDRVHRSTLMRVGLNLPALAAQ